MPLPDREKTLTQTSTLSVQDPSAQGPITAAQAHTDAYRYYADAVVAALGSHADAGLRPAEAKQRLEQYGANELEGESGIPYVRIFVSQLVNAMNLVSMHSSTHCAPQRADPAPPGRCSSSHLPSRSRF